MESFPGWSWNANEGKWDRGKHFLLQFIERERHSRAKHSHMEEGFALGQWLQMHRQKYNKGELSQEKITFFESLPEWSWTVKTDRWTEAFHLLQEYAKREGHARVPISHTEQTTKLGIWVRTQRYSYSKQTYGKNLPPDKIKLLESVPGWTWKIQ